MERQRGKRVRKSIAEREEALFHQSSSSSQPSSSSSSKGLALLKSLCAQRSDKHEHRVRGAAVLLVSSPLERLSGFNYSFNAEVGLEHTANISLSVTLMCGFEQDEDFSCPRSTAQQLCHQWSV